MPVAAKAKGFGTRAAYKAASDWTTAVVCGALNGFEILSETVKDSVELARDESFNGSPVPYPGGPGNETVDGPISVNLKYDDVTLLMLAQLMGADDITGTGDPYTHVLSLMEDNSGLFGTLILTRGSFEVWEYANVKPTKFTFTVNLSEQFVKADISFLGYTRTINTSSGTNTLTTLEDVTMGYTDKLLVKPGHITVWLAEADETGDFADGDKFCVTDLSLDLGRVVEALRTSCTHGKQSEPTDNGFATLAGKMTIPAYEDGMRDLIAACQAKTVYKMRWKFTLPDATPARSIQFDFPAVQLTNDGPNASAVGRLPLPLNFDAFRALEAPDGMSKDLFYITITNPHATEYVPGTP